jgi:hypothetical protein
MKPLSDPHVPRNQLFDVGVEIGDKRPLILSLFHIESSCPLL